MMLMGLVASTTTIQVGRSDISRTEDESVYAIEDVVIHPGYNPADSYIDDIALLKLRKPLVFSDQVQPVRLPKRFFEIDVQESNLVTLVGWGRNASDGPVQTTLQEIDYYAVPNDECNRIHSNHIYPTQICAAEPGGGKGQCSHLSHTPDGSNQGQTSASSGLESLVKISKMC
uniref:Peptidase S1 domain-containing protein n=1 Tax=Anopheles merus TaxID=30066 RepID=A0A182USI9_ANOME